MIPESLDPSPYLLRSSVRKIEKRRAPICAYTMGKEAAITSKMPSASKGSSNPGVSIRVTTLPSRVNSSEGWILAVRDSEPAENGLFEPLARLINWGQLSEFLVNFAKHALLTVVFPLPVAPMTL